MPLEQYTIKTSVFRVLIADAENALGITPGTSVRWSYDGENIVVELDPEPPETGPPIPPGFERVRTPFLLTTWESIRQQFFSGFPPELFDRMAVWSDTTYVLFNLNNRELP